MNSAVVLPNLTHIVRRLVNHILPLVLVVSTLSMITPEVANAATVGSAPCTQTVDSSLNVQVTSSGGYCYVAFKSGTRVWTPPAGVSMIDLLVVGGGGGGASRHAGGGGAGGLLQNTNLSINGTDLTITVGAGGAGGAAQSAGGANANSGETSTVSGGGITTRNAIGGGGGSYGASAGSSGGSGGGGGSSGSGGARTLGQGNNGSAGLTNDNTYWVGGGGGGAGGAGTTSQSTKGGSGGVGLEISWIPTSVGQTLGVGVAGVTGRFFAGGGGGGSDRNPVVGGDGGTGGGGASATVTADVNPGIANTGGGGGGSGVSGVNNGSKKGGDGGSGVVVVRYVPDTNAPTISSAALNSSGTSIVLTYNETLSATTAATSAFAVSDSGTAVSLSSVTASGFTVTLALASTINIGRVVTLSYADPTGSDDANAIQDSAGNDAISLSSRSVTNNSTVKATPTFSSWSNVTKTYGDANYTVTAPTVTGSIAGSFSYSSSNTGVISISDTTFTVAGGGSATITATFTPTDTTNYNSASTTNTVTVNKASQSAITITTTAATYGSNLTLASTGGSTGGSYSYTKVSGNCTLSGAVLTPTATGSCVVQSTLAANANYLAETSTATTITISSGSVSASLTLEPGSLVFRQAKNITAVATVAGKITFRVAGKILPGCKNRTVNAGNSFTATCSYRPSNHSYVTISATLDPNDSYYVGTVTNSAQYLVTRRVGRR